MPKTTGVAVVQGVNARSSPHDLATNKHAHGATDRATANSVARTSPGVLITDLNFKPVYANGPAIEVLSYPSSLHEVDDWAGLVHERIRFILGFERVAQSPPPKCFASGRRQYLCRAFLLGSRRARGRRAMLAILLERQPLERTDLLKAALRFRLSQRERETVQLLIHGLTTKEIAERMGISPNTVKQFIRLVMSKMSVSTRSGIIGSILSR